MTKQEAIEAIRKAKMNHKKWISYAKAIHMGIPVDKNAVPMLETECGFGQWYYGEGQVFSDFDSYQTIEEPHAMLHHKYMQLYKARKAPVKGGFFTSKSKAQNKKNELLNKHMEQLIQISELLLENLKSFEDDLKQLSETDFINLK